MGDVAGTFKTVLAINLLFYMLFGYVLECGMADFVSATYQIHSLLFGSDQPLKGLFSRAYLHSLLLLNSLRLNSFLFIAW